MIIGIGTDISDIARMRRVTKQCGSRFLEKIFTRAEIEYCSSMADPAVHFTARWAAKEAFYKALPDSIQLHSSWKSIQVISEKCTRKPKIELLDQQLRLQCNQIGRAHV